MDGLSILVQNADTLARHHDTMDPPNFAFRNQFIGIGELLTKEISLTSAVINWKEPELFRILLRNHLVSGLLIILGTWLGTAGLFLLDV